MQRFTFCPLLSLLLLIGTVTPGIGPVVAGQSPAKTQTDENKGAAAPPKQERTYKRGPAGLGVRSDDSLVSFITFDSSDGMHFIKWSRNFGSPEEAEAELGKILEKALEVVKREDVTDEDGKRVGSKVTATFPPDTRDYGPASLIWTEGEEMFEVHSASLQNISEYRKDFKR